MMFRAIALPVLLATASAASAQSRQPAPAAGTVPPPLPASSNQSLTPKVVQPRPARRVRPHGEPIVKGNTDIFVDSYGQLSTTMQP